MEEMLAYLRQVFPSLRFIAADQFAWSPETGEILYKNSTVTDNTEAIWSLLHETGHALLGHSLYNSDIQLLQFEVAAWHVARQLAQKLNLTIDETHIQSCLDTYRDWLYARSKCPTCTTTCLQLANTLNYRCHSCHSRWSVTPARFARPYRTRSTATEPVLLA